MPEPSRQRPLEPGHQLQCYQIERILGESNFGITYLARDLNLDRLVAIKEYLPSDLAAREGSVFVYPIRDEFDEQYHSGLELFLAEARVLAKIDHPNIVRVLNVFVYHNTAYMVMLYEEGKRLSEFLEERRTLKESELISILLPILDGLDRVHQSGYLHCDIRPANILIRSNDSPVLLGFGTVRQAPGESASDAVASKFTAIEQYYENSDQLGPWTDIYGMAATVYRGLAGVAPADALQRSQAILHGAKDPLIAASQVGGSRYTSAFLRAIEHALNLNPSERPQTIEAWRRGLVDNSIASSPTTTEPVTVASPDLPLLVDDDAPQGRKSANWRWSVATLLLAGIALGLILLAYVSLWDNQPDLHEQPPKSSVVEVAPGGQRDKAVDRLVQNARRAMHRSQWAKADKYLSQATALAPSAEDVKDLRVQLTARRAQAESAQAPATQPTTSQHASNMVANFIDLAKKAIKTQQWDKAQANINKAIILAPDSEEVTALQVDLMSRRARSEEAQRAGQETGVTRESGVASRDESPGDGSLADDSLARSRGEQQRDQVVDIVPAERIEPSASVRIQRASASLSSVSPGDTVKFFTEYSLNLPTNVKYELVEVHWALKRDGHRLGEEGVALRMVKAGTNIATNEFTLPSYMKPGRYTVEHKVQVNGQSDLGQTYFTVVPQ